MKEPRTWVTDTTLSTAALDKRLATVERRWEAIKRLALAKYNGRVIPAAEEYNRKHPL